MFPSIALLESEEKSPVGSGRNEAHCTRSRKAVDMFPPIALLESEEKSPAGSGRNEAHRTRKAKDPKVRSLRISLLLLHRMHNKI